VAMPVVALVVVTDIVVVHRDTIRVGNENAAMIGIKLTITRFWSPSMANYFTR